MLQEAWGVIGPATSVSELAEKLGAIAGALSRWGWCTFGSVRLELRSLRQQLAVLRAAPLRTGPGEE